MAQGCLIPFADKFILDELSYSSMWLVSVKSIQRGRNDGLRTEQLFRSTTLHSMPLDWSHLSRVVKTFLFLQHEYVW